MFDQYNDIVTVKELCQMLNIGRNTAYDLLKNNRIRHVKVGKKYIIPKTAALAFIGEICYNDKQIINGRLSG